MTRDTLHADLWALTHAARRSLAADLSGLTEEQWPQQTLCADWDVEHVVAHLTAAAEVGRPRWIVSIVASGFRPSVHNARRLREHLGATPEESLRRFQGVRALTPVAEFYARRDFTVPSRSLTSGLRLRATDGPFVAGDGSDVAGPTVALVMTMAGRHPYLERLEGPGVSILVDRIG